MYRIVHREPLNASVVRIAVEAPLVARKALPGQFIILRVDEEGERIPLTVAGTDKEEGTVTVIYQIVGATTEKLSHVEEGEYLSDFAGPLGKPTEIEGKKNVCIVGGGVGCAIAYPVAKAFHDAGAQVTAITGFRSKDIVILEDDFKAISDRHYLMTDDGTYGEKGNVTMPLKKLLEAGERFDEVVAVGPIIMMKYTVETCRQFGQSVTASMAQIMVDGTGMCGGCRLTLVRDGKRITKFACVDGPDFNGYEVDFDEALSRAKMYNGFERHAYEKTCNLFKLKQRR